MTPSERKVLQCLASAGDNREIAARLHVCESTVRTHLRSLFHKLGVRNRTGLVVVALREGLISLEELEISSESTIDAERPPPLQ